METARPRHRRSCDERANIKRKMRETRGNFIDFRRNSGYNKGVVGALWPSDLSNTPRESEGTSVTFQIGDKVIYPNHGLGIVERIEEKTILGHDVRLLPPPHCRQRHDGARAVGQRRRRRLAPRD
ncbi:MAG: hypothetical protein MZV64_15335 [Ignavibacteriales bacterium]|nr:hypothetical protein [Ignavibacteriales bacterium]